MKAVAPLNILAMYVTLDVFQLLIFWLNEEALANILRISGHARRVPGANVLIKSGGRHKCTLHSLYFSCIPGSNVLIEGYSVVSV